MQELTDLDLCYLPIEEQAFSPDPFAWFESARKVHPWLARTSFGYIIIDSRAIREMIAYEDRVKMGHSDIAEFMGAKGSPWGRFIEDNIQGQTGDTHRRLRGAVASAFTPGKLEKYRPMMRATLCELLHQWGPGGALDFEEFISHYPISVMCRMLGAPTTVVADIRESLEMLGLAFGMDRALLPALNDAVTDLDDFVRGLVADRRANVSERKEEDLLDNLLAAVETGKMSDEELYSLLIFLFGAGYDTSKNVLTLALYTLMDRPDIYARCADDFPFCRKVVNECLRYMNPASSTRHVVEPFTHRGVRFAEGTVYMFPWCISGRDGNAVVDPDRFDPEREQGSPHLAFGSGPHICLGQFIARIQLEEGLHQLARCIRNPRLAGEFGWRLFPGVWGLRGLPIEFDYHPPSGHPPSGHPPSGHPPSGALRQNSPETGSGTPATQ